MTAEGYIFAFVLGCLIGFIIRKIEEAYNG
jgi:hypothetical protein